MNKKVSRIIAGSLSAMFVGQALIFGDGASYSILYVETVMTVAIKWRCLEQKENLCWRQL